MKIILKITIKYYMKILIKLIQITANIYLINGASKSSGSESIEPSNAPRRKLNLSSVVYFSFLPCRLGLPIKGRLSYLRFLLVGTYTFFLLRYSILSNVPFNYSYINVMDFDTITEQTAYFSSASRTSSST